MQTKPFREMATAPTNGTVIEVRHGPAQHIVRAEWSGQGQAWISEDDPHRKALHQVTGWRPITMAPRPFRPISTAPTDILVEVIHGTRQAVTVAQWDSQRHMWIRANDPASRTLLRVTGWRPVKE